MREDPSSEGRGPQRRRRQQTAGRQRAITLGFVVLVIIVVVVLALTVPQAQKSASSTTKSTTTTTVAGETTSSEAGAGTESTESTVAGETTTQTENTLTTVFTADLTGGNVVPSVQTAASGKLTLTVSADGTTVDYKLDVDHIIGLTIARLHQGKVGANGPTVFTIYNGPIKDGLFSGTVTHGSFTAADFVGPLKGQTIDDFVGMIDSNEIYLAVATGTHHDGELRGQLQ